MTQMQRLPPAHVSCQLQRATWRHCHVLLLETWPLNPACEASCGQSCTSE